MRKLLLLFLLAVPSLTWAQKLRITGIDLKGDRLVVAYTLEDNNLSTLYQVDLYSSADNFAQPLTKVSGDIGADVKPGEKKVEWKIREEIGAYAGDISVEVRARVYIAFLKLASIDKDRKFKRGRSYPLVWTSGNFGGQVDIDLYNGKERVKSDHNIPNTGKYEWYIDGSVKPGKTYTLRFTNTRNRDEFVMSNTFTIVPKISLPVKLVSVLLVGGGIAAAAALLGGDNNGGDPTKKADLPALELVTPSNN